MDRLAEGGLPNGSVLDVSYETGGERALVQTRQGTYLLVAYEWNVRRGDKRLRYAPHRFISGHPVDAVEALQIQWAREATQGALSPQVVIALKVAQSQLADAAINRLAKPQPRIVRFRNGSPVSVHAIHGQHVIVVAHSLEIHDKWSKAVHPQGRGGKESAFQAMRRAVLEHEAGRPCGVGMVVGKVVQEALDAYGCLERAQGAQFRGRER